MRKDHPHTNSRDGAGLLRLRAAKNAEQVRADTVRLQREALQRADAKIKQEPKP